MTFAVAGRAERRPVADPHGAGEHPDVGDLLAGRAALDLEHRAGQRAVGVAGGGRQQLGDAGDQRVDPGAGDGRAEEHRVHQRPPGLRGQRRAQPAVRDGRASSTYAASSASSCSASSSTSRSRRPGRRAVRRDARRRVPVPSTAPIGTIAGRQLGRRFAAAPASASRAGAVDLVDEDQRRDAQPLQRPHQHPGLRLHALDGGDDQHRAVEHAERPLHLGDEVRVAGGVDQVDRDVADGERDDGGLDGDAALAFERQRVGLGAAGVDAADLVDDPGGVQQPLGQAGLTGVDMRQDPQVEQCARSVMSSR